MEVPLTMAATVKDIARRTGLGLATISKYINGGHVLPKNQAAIEEAIQALDFKVNETARNLKTKRTGYVGLVMPALGNSFMMELVQQIQLDLRQQGYGTALYASAPGHAVLRKQSELEAVDFLLQKGVDGIINLPVNEDGAHLLKPLEMGIPITLIDKQIPELADQVSSVIIDNVGAARAATDELLNAGHRNILGLFHDENNYTGRRRAEGFVDALRERSCPIDPEKVIFLAGLRHDETIQRIREALRKHRPTAVFAANSGMTSAALTAIEDEGLRIPEDISIVGFDGVGSEFGQRVKIASVMQPTLQIGSTAAQIMAEHLRASIRGETLPAQLRTLPATLFRGSSIARL